MSSDGRKATVKRKTNETHISVSLDLDGSGQHEIKTGVGFLDHMLVQLARHGLFDLNVSCTGDLEIDAHHTIEDVGIAIGTAFAAALDNKAGIERYGFCLLPMDDALTRCALDFSGRPYLVWSVKLPAQRLGTVDTEAFQEWFQGFVVASGLTLHIETLAGHNTHHIIESSYKAFARAVRDATRINPRLAGQIPSSKGVL